MHDGAPPCVSRFVCNFLHTRFPYGKIGRDGLAHWPARSPDMNYLDLLLGTYYYYPFEVTHLFQKHPVFNKYSPDFNGCKPIVIKKI